MRKVRRVMTGVDHEGKSVFVSDEQVTGVSPPLLGGTELVALHGADDVETVPVIDFQSEPGRRRYLPEPEGYRFSIFSFPPKGGITVPEDFEAALAQSVQIVPGIEDVVAERDGRHYTPTVDLEYVIEGQFRLTLDDGASKILRAGDCLVQCGAKHSWTNEGSGPATMLLVFIGARLDESRFGDRRIRQRSRP